MASRSVSPGGALLRASRMFSLPNPIPPPVTDSSSGATSFSSNTATLDFPTHQVITTLSSARKQGDWGLKRPLPLKSTTRSTHPMLRVKAIDTIEQITDYTSATDHGMTLRKFQELGMPLTARRPAGGDTGDNSKGKQTATMNLPQKSVFEDELDVTDMHPDKRAKAIDNRWRFNGPWLAGMTEGKFQKWLEKEVRPRRPEFREFLRKKIAGELRAAAANEALDKGTEAPGPVGPSSVTEDQLIDYLRKLRHNNQALYDLVGQFLDLAPLIPPNISQLDLPAGFSNIEWRQMRNPYAEGGPPVTHPSAGISYLRTSMYMDNHPIYGPQKQHPSVVARIVKPRRQAQASPAKLGVAGFIVNTPLGDTKFNSKNNDLFDKIDPSVVGGPKVWVQPKRASVDANGRVVLTVDDAPAEARLVAQELLGLATCLGARRDEGQAGRPESASEIRQRYAAADAPAMSSIQNYGIQR
ncbi:hypothetical protein N657DRAFT_642649 [Parathielavia appendiculata]|uniref:Uncharacterized protein n=1 Tax=Parathielavia appendiculata TaxID=2587402 RepID=A0AAN6Z500_9PEZI|nr:hypothetical protein N657DRAFT_642649 [Parathielavia appendiculata]